MTTSPDPVPQVRATPDEARQARILLRAVRAGDVLAGEVAAGRQPAELHTVVATGVDSEGDPIITMVSGSGRRSVVTTSPESIAGWNLRPVHRPDPDRGLDVAGPAVDR